MYVPERHIQIGPVTIREVTSASISMSWKSITAVCSITLPRNIFFKGQRLENLIKVGHPVKYSLGYDGKTELEFIGYVARIIPTTPMKIECEDEMWKWKQTSYTGSFDKSITLKELLSQMMPGVSVGIISDINIGRVRFSKLSPAKILDKLRDEFGLYSYFIDGKLYSGLPYLNSPRDIAYSFDRDIMPNDSLQYRSKDEVKVRIRAISNKPDGSKLKWEDGDEDGQLRTLNFYDKSLEDLKELAKREISLMKLDGYTGSFKTWNTHICNHGDIVKLTGGEYPTREGSYYVDAVEVTDGKDGQHRNISLGGRVK